MRLQNKSALAYVFRNFLHLFLPALVTAFLLGFFADVANVVGFFTYAIQGTLTAENFVENLLECFSFLRFGKDFWVMFIALLAFILTECFLGVRVGRHMRTGLVDFLRPRSVLPFFTQMSLYVGMFVVGYELLQMVVVGVGSIVITSGNVILTWIITMVLEVVCEGVTAYFAAMSVCTFPAGYVEGFMLGSALSYSIRLVSQSGKFVFRFVTEFLISRILIYVIAYFVGDVALFGEFTLANVCYALFYLWWMVYVVAIAFCYYYHFTDVERRDITRKLWRN